MPRINGQTPAKQSEGGADYQLHIRLLTAFKTVWVEQAKQAGVDPMVYSRMSMIALSQLAAVVAVDVGMTPKQFVAVCEAQFEEAHKRAPKFGD